MPRDQFEEQQERQRHATRQVQAVQRTYGGALTFAQLLREFRNAGKAYDEMPEAERAA